MHHRTKSLNKFGSGKNAPVSPCQHTLLSFCPYRSASSASESTSAILRQVPGGKCKLEGLPWATGGILGGGGSMPGGGTGMSGGDGGGEDMSLIEGESDECATRLLRRLPADFLPATNSSYTVR